MQFLVREYMEDQFRLGEKEERLDHNQTLFKATEAHHNSNMYGLMFFFPQSEIVYTQKESYAI